MGLHLCIVSKDILGARMARPIGEALQQMGHNIHCVLEAKAVDVFKGSHLPTFDADVEPTRLLSELSIDAVIVSYGSPIHLEETFAYAANKLDIPVIGLEDYWCGHRRTDAVTNCVLTIDELAATYAREDLTSKHVYVVGNPAIDTQLSVPREVEADMAALRERYKNVFMYVDSGADSGAEHIELLIACLQRSSIEYCIIPRYHPKWANVLDPENPPETYHEVWNRMFAVLGERVQRVEYERTDPVAALADVTFSGLSSLMTTAVYHGRQAVSLRTPRTVTQIQKETGIFTQSPLVLMDLAHEIREPVPIEKILEDPKRTGPVGIEPYDVQKATRAVCTFLGSKT